MPYFEPLEPHIRVIKDPVSVQVIQEAAHFLDILDHSTKFLIRYEIDIHTSVVTVRNLHTEQILDRFRVYLSFEKDAVHHLDVLRSAIRTYALVRQGAYENHFFVFSSLL